MGDYKIHFAQSTHSKMTYMGRQNVVINMMSGIFGLMIFIWMALAIRRGAIEINEMNAKLNERELARKSENSPNIENSENFKPEKQPIDLNFEIYERKTRDSKTDESPELIESTFTEPRSNFELNNFEINNFEINQQEIYQYTQETSNFRKVKDVIFPSWLKYGCLTVGETIAFWKPSNKNSRNSTDSSVDGIENIAIGSAIFGTVVAAVGFSWASRKENAEIGSRHVKFDV